DELEFVADDRVPRTICGVSRVEAEKALGIGVIPILLISGAPIDLVPLPGLPPLLKVEVEIVQVSSDEGVSDAAFVKGELQHAFVAWRRRSGPSRLHGTAFVIAVALHEVHFGGRLQGVGKGFVAAGSEQLALHRQLVFGTGLEVHTKPKATRSLVQVL